ncbi:MAG: hypothetical protein FJ030_07645 [Chloroflexi bacterium]|nr:hypothetical protein [Chloroflexota bacterium]
MNKKLIVIAGSLVVVNALAVAGVAAAQTPTPVPPTGGGYGYGYGMMGGGYARGAHGFGMMGGRSANFAESGPMHEAMFNALAEGLGLSREELDKRVAAGETPYQIATSLGFSQTEFAAIMTEARTAAINEAAAAGTLTQEQADWMLSHMGGRGGFGRGAYGGACPHIAPTPAPNS